MDPTPLRFFQAGGVGGQRRFAVIATVLTVAAAVVGVLALALPALLIGAAVLGAVVLGVDAYLWATDRKSGWDVALGAIGLATLGFGRAFGAAAKAGHAAKAARPVAALRYQALRASHNNPAGMARSRAGWRATRSGRAPRKLGPDQISRAMRSQDVERVAQAQRALDEAKAVVSSHHVPQHNSWPSWRSVREGFSPRQIWRDSREAFVEMRQSGVVSTARKNLDELSVMARGGDDFGTHGEMTYELARAGTGIAGLQILKVGIDASR